MTFSILHDFLAPQKRYVADVQATYVTSYIRGETSYREVAWAEDDREREDAEASLSRSYRAVDEACRRALELLFRAQRGLVSSVTDLLCEPTETGEERWGRRAKSQQKRDQLNLLSYLFRLLSHVLEKKAEPEIDWSAGIFAKYRGLTLGFRLSTPQSLKQALF